MFIKWAKDITSTWFKANEENVVGCWGFWIIMAWIITIAFVLVSNSPKANEDHVFVIARNILVPLCLVTGILPTCILILALIGMWLENLYLDYQYFKANGGKRKRDEEQP